MQKKKRIHNCCLVRIENSVTNAIKGSYIRVCKNMYFLFETHNLEMSHCFDSV